MSFDPAKHYQENAGSASQPGTILGKRKQKYDSDPEYREAQRKRAREYARKRQAEKQAASTDMPVTKIRRPRRPQWVQLVGGEKVKMYTVGTLAQALGKTTQTISSWERKGYVPESPFRARGDVRLYSQEMIEVVVETLKGRPIRLDDDEVPKGIASAWASLGVVPGVRYEMIDE